MSSYPQTDAPVTGEKAKCPNGPPVQDQKPPPKSPENTTQPTSTQTPKKRVSFDFSNKVDHGSAYSWGTPRQSSGNVSPMKSILKTRTPSGLADMSPNFGNGADTSQFGLVESIPKTDSYFMPYY